MLGRAVVLFTREDPENNHNATLFARVRK
jgi:hypothetical protein